MATVRQNKDSGKWYARWYEDGKLREKTIPDVKRRNEAIGVAEKWEELAKERSRGDALHFEGGEWTVAQLMKWWLDRYSSKLAGHRSSELVVTKHFIDDPFGKKKLAKLRPTDIEDFLDERRARGLKPQTLIHLRGYISRAFHKAKRARMVTGDCPTDFVEKEKTTTRKHNTLQSDEILPLLQATVPHHQALFMTAICTGMRKGELFGLRKCDVDLTRQVITVRHSHGRDTTKGGTERHIPILDELIPWLTPAVEEAPGEYVFPETDGKRRRVDFDLVEPLRSALGRAGIVDGYTHTCRTCGYAVDALDRALRRCPNEKHKLWPVSHPRPLRFHDLRHTAASLFLAAGVDAVVVQRILGHSDLRLTTQTYGHLLVGHLATQAAKLKLPGMSPEDVYGENMGKTAKAPEKAPKRRAKTSSKNSGLERARPPGFEPGTVGLEEVLDYLDYSSGPCGSMSSVVPRLADPCRSCHVWSSFGHNFGHGCDSGTRWRLEWRPRRRA